MHIKLHLRAGGRVQVKGGAMGQKILGSNVILP